VLFDRAMWWPAAADLRPYATVVAVDLPGHGDSDRRADYRLDDIVDELAQLVQGLAVARDPILVGHATAAPLAEAFARHYPVQALVIVDPLDCAHGGSAGTAMLEDYLADMSPDAVPARYRHLVTPVFDAQLLSAYTATPFDARPTPPGARPPASRLTIRGRDSQPAAGCVTGQGPRAGISRTYETDGRYAHLTDLDRFVGDLRALL
jgi:pimeloyl-ACP methyl ester carboxylesterase